MAKLPEDDLQKRLGDLYGKIPIYPEGRHCAQALFRLEDLPPAED